MASDPSFTTQRVTEKEPIKEVQPIEVIKQPEQPKATKTGPISSKLKENLLVMFVCIVFSSNFVINFILKITTLWGSFFFWFYFLMK